MRLLGLGWFAVAGTMVDMKSFRATMIEVSSNGQPVLRTPVDFSGRVGEAKLEEWLIAHPELTGEALLVLGSQLAEFAEDKDRLDVLAVDESGEIVLVELKVDESFRVTDLQALAYAGAYASMPTSHLAGVLKKQLEKTGADDSTLEHAKERIASFIGLDFDEWHPSRRVRIKLLAPGFPKRVLKTVKWLGDVYEMPIEAIEVKLFEDSLGAYHLTVERLLPVRGDDSFDLTVRDTEARRQVENITRRPAVLNTLIAHGDITEGQRLWLHPSSLYPDCRDAWDAENPIFQVKVDASGPAPRFRWRPTDDAPEQLLAPSTTWHAILETLYPGRYEKRHWPVHNAYSTAPLGETLGELAERTGAWTTAAD
jgi:hypothetical protein